jgi:hypothetical protein
MNSNETTKPPQVGGSALNDVLGLINAFTKEQERLWENVRNCAINNKIPKELPIDAVLFVSTDRFEDLPILFKMQFAGRVFANNLLQNDRMIITKRPNVELTGRSMES